MDPYLIRLRNDAIAKYNELQALDLVIKRLQMSIVQLIAEGSVLSQDTLELSNIFLKLYTNARDQYQTAKQLYETQSIEVAKETAQAQIRLEASKHIHRTFLPLGNGTFGVYVLPSRLDYSDSLIWMS